MVVTTLININMIAFLVKYLIACDVHPITVNITSTWHDELVHAILTKITSACGMFTSYWEYTMGLDHKYCNNLCDPKVEGKLVINLFFICLYFVIVSLSISNNCNMWEKQM
jgi:hypothetical protein